MAKQIDHHQIHDFADTWLHRFRLKQGKDGEFVDGLLQLGFEMDNGHAIAAYTEHELPGAVYTDQQSWLLLLPSIEQVPLLGSALFSYARYLTHWAEEPLADYRDWFVAGLTRLAELTAERYTPPRFDRFKRLTLITERFGGGPEPLSGTPVAQKLIVKRNGRVTLLRFVHQHHETVLAGSAEYQLTKKRVKPLFKLLRARFTPATPPVTAVAPAGIWQLVVKTNPGTLQQFSGSIGSPVYQEETDLSALFRKRLGIPDLWAFDGDQRPLTPGKDDVIFLSVTFPHGYTTYYYQTDDPTILLGERVLVPVGPDNHQVPATVMGRDVFARAAVPMPLTQVKTIICRLD